MSWERRKHFRVESMVVVTLRPEANSRLEGQGPHPLFASSSLSGIGTNTMPTASNKSFAESLSDPSLIMIAEMLGTPPDDGYEYLMDPAVFLEDLNSMIQVCHDALRHSTCGWRWHWASDEEEAAHYLRNTITDEPRLQLFSLLEGGSSKWLELWTRYGRCLVNRGRGRKTGWRWEQDYSLMIEVHKNDLLGHRVISATGSLVIEDDDFIMDTWRVRAGDDGFCQNGEWGTGTY